MDFGWTIQCGSGSDESFVGSPDHAAPTLHEFHTAPVVGTDLQKLEGLRRLNLYLPKLPLCVSLQNLQGRLIHVRAIPSVVAQGLQRTGQR